MNKAVRKFYSCGRDIYIADTVIIKRPQLVAIGSHIAIDDFTYITTGMNIGSWIHISPHVSIIGGADAGLVMGDFCTISAGARISCRGDAMLGDGLVGPFIPVRYRDKLIGGTVVIGSFCSIGTNAVIAPGVTIGEGAVIGANSYVNKDVPAWEIWVGSPARYLKSRPSTQMLKYAEELMKNE